MKRVLIVFPNLNSGVGPPRALVNLLNTLPREGFEYNLLLTSRRKNEFKHLWDRIPKWVNVLPPLYQLSTYSAELMSELRRDCMDFAADIKEKVHELNSSKGVDRFRNWEYLKQITPEYSGYDIAVAYTEDIALQIVCDRVSSVKKIGWVHIDYKQTWDDNAILNKREQWNKMDKIVCVSRQNAEAFAECYEELCDRIVHIHNPNDPTYIHQQAEAFFPPEYADANGCVKIFTSGTIGTRKGADFILYATKKLISEGYSIKWFIAGKPDTRDGGEYVRQITKEELSNHIILLGYQPNPYPYFINCDIYVHPSRYEGLSVAIQEAKILCKPILVTNHSSADEVITDGKNGIICDINAESLTEKLRMMLDDRTLRDRLSDNLKNQKEDDNTRANLEKLFSL